MALKGADWFWAPPGFSVSCTETCGISWTATRQFLFWWGFILLRVVVYMGRMGKQVALSPREGWVDVTRTGFGLALPDWISGAHWVSIIPTNSHACRGQASDRNDWKRLGGILVDSRMWLHLEKRAASELELIVDMLSYGLNVAAFLFFKKRWKSWLIKMWTISVGILITIHSSLKKFHCKFITLELKSFCVNTLLSHTVDKFVPGNNNRIAS